MSQTLKNVLYGNNWIFFVFFWVLPLQAADKRLKPRPKIVKLKRFRTVGGPGVASAKTTSQSASRHSLLTVSARNRRRRTCRTRESCFTSRSLRTAVAAFVHRTAYFCDFRDSWINVTDCVVVFGTAYDSVPLKTRKHVGVTATVFHQNRGSFAPSLAACAERVIQSLRFSVINLRNHPVSYKLTTFRQFKVFF